MTIEAMKQALEALENLQGLCSEEGNFIEQLTIWTPEAMYALRTAIAEAEKQEPVAWAVFEGRNAHDLYLPQEYDEALKMAGYKGDHAAVKPLYAHPPAAQQEPDAYGYAKRLAEAIWQKHYKATAPQWKPLDDLMGVLTQIDNMTAGLTAQRQPLTDKQIGKILDDPNIAETHQGNWLVLPYAFARAIEAAHGIGEKT